MENGISAAPPRTAIFSLSGFSPDFFKPPAPSTEAAEGISLPQRPGETASEFEQSPQFALFARQFQTQLDCIKHFAREHLGDSAHEICNVFDQFSGRIFNTGYDFFGKEKSILYGAGKRSLDRFAGLLADAGIDLACRQTSVLHLADGVQECAAGAAVNLADAAKTLQSMQGGNFLRMKDAMATALISDAYNAMDMTQIPVGYEIHYGTRLRNALADSVGIEKYDDPIANERPCPDEVVEFARQYVMKRLTPARLAMALAEEYLRDFRQPIVERLAQQHRSAQAPFDFQEFSDGLTSAMAPLEKYGDVGMYSVITPVDAHYRNVRLNADPSLIAIDILNEQRRNGNVAASYRATLLYNWRHLDTEIRLMHHEDKIAWATENDEPHLLRAKHLMLISPKNFKGRENVAKRIVANVITNEPPEILQSCLPPAWLSIADAERVFSAWTPVALSRYLKRHVSHIAGLPRFRRLAIIRGVVACGTVSDLALCAEQGRLLFAPPINPALVIPPFFRIALLRGDRAMLHAVNALLMDAAAKCGAIKRQVRTILAGESNGVPAFCAALSRTAHNPALLPFAEILIQAQVSKLITSDALENILSAKDTWQTPGFLFTMNNNDRTKVKEFGAIVMQAAQQGALNSKQVTTLLSATAECGIPGFHFALVGNCADAIMAFAGVVVAAYDKKILDQAQVYILFSGPLQDGRPGLSYAAANGHTDAVTAFGKALLIAIKHKALTGAQVNALLIGAGSWPVQPLELAIHRALAATVAAFGAILLDLYGQGVLNRDQVCFILAGAAPEHTRLLMQSLTPQHDAVIDALAKIVFAAEKIRRKTDGPDSLPLATFNLSKSALPPALVQARSSAELRAQAEDIRTLRIALQSKLALRKDAEAAAGALKRRMRKSRLGLFFYPGNAAAKEKLFSDVMQEWEILKNRRSARDI